MAGFIKNAKRTIKNWWLFVILGILLILTGIWVIRTPVESYVSLAILFSIMVFVNGIIDIAFSISNSEYIKGWGWKLAGGILEMLLGVFLMIYPEVSIEVLPLVLGFWLLFGAVSVISGAFDLKSYRIQGWGWMLFLGILLLISSFIILVNPVVGSSVIVVMTSIALITYGVSYIMLGLKLKKVKDFASDLKHAFRDDLERLKKEVIAAYEQAGDQSAGQEAVNKKFDSFKESI